MAKWLASILAMIVGWTLMGGMLSLEKGGNFWSGVGSSFNLGSLVMIAFFFLFRKIFRSKCGSEKCDTK